jgi:hypothetical protein
VQELLDDKYDNIGKERTQKAGIVREPWYFPAFPKP